MLSERGDNSIVYICGVKKKIGDVKTEVFLAELMRPEKKQILHLIKLSKDIVYVFLEKLNWGSVAEASVFPSYLRALCLLAAG